MTVTSPCDATSNAAVLSGVGFSGVKVHHMLRYTDVCMQRVQGSNPSEDLKVVKIAPMFSALGFLHDC